MHVFADYIDDLFNIFFHCVKWSLVNHFVVLSLDFDTDIKHFDTLYDVINSDLNKEVFPLGTIFVRLSTKFLKKLIQTIDNTPAESNSCTHSNDAEYITSITKFNLIHIPYRAIENFFTVLYGIYPRTTFDKISSHLANLQQWINNDQQQAKFADDDLELVEDPFSNTRTLVIDDEDASGFDELDEIKKKISVCEYLMFYAQKFFY